MLHVTKTNGVLHRSDPRFCCIAVGPECGTGVDRISERTLCVGRRRASCRFSRWSGSHALAPICVRRVCVRDAWHLSTDAKRSVGGHGELFDEFGSVIDGWERSDLGCDLTGAVSVLPVLEKPAQRSSDLVGGSLVLADGESCAELHQLGRIEPVVWWGERKAQDGESSLERSRAIRVGRCRLVRPVRGYEAGCGPGRRRSAEGGGEVAHDRDGCLLEFVCVCG